MKKYLVTTLASVLVLSVIVVGQPASAQAICHAQNNFGVWFWGANPDLAVAICQQNTPVGGVCFFRGC